jgi:hypothetical protein
MTKEQLQLIEALIEASVKEHASDSVAHRKGSYVMKKIYSKKARKIHQKLLATCDPNEFNEFTT